MFLSAPRPKLLVVTLCCLTALTARAQERWQSDIIYEDAGGRLAYVSDADGNRIPDFSHAGYGGGGVAIPEVPVLETLSPVEGDNTAHIQAALDRVAATEPDADGLRGTVLLTPGTYIVNGTLYLRRGGMVLRGAGGDEDPASNTILHRTSLGQDPIIYAGRNDLEGGNEALIRRDNSRLASLITDAFVPVGSTSFNVDEPSRYAEGDEIVVLHPTTLAWLSAVDFGGTASDPGWRVGQDPIAFVRRIERVDGNTVTIDAPVFNHLDRSLAQSYIYLRNRNGVIANVGIESLRIDIDSEGPTAETQAANAVELALVEDSWVTGVTALHFWHAGVSIQESRHVTVRGSRALEPHSIITGERRYNFEVYHSQLVLFEGNLATEARHAFVGNGETRDSGIVLLDNVSEDAHTSSEAHRTWGMGFLFDNHTERGSRGSSVSDRRIHIGNRGDYGTAHGWACAHCVVWNSNMNGSPVVVEKPPTAQNYAIGVQGKVLDYGPFTANTNPYIEGTNRSGLDPSSLYRRQLEERLKPVRREEEPELPDERVRVSPNYPNPFRGETSIDVDLEVPGKITLAVYDLLGREVLRPADTLFAAGRRTIRVDAQGLAPGVYLYRMRAAIEGQTQVITRRMVVAQ